MKRFNEFQLDPVNECLWQEGTRLSLTPKAFAILDCLVENAGRIVTKDEFMERVWPGVYVGEENLKVYIRELRGLLGDQAAKPQYIETCRDKGYRFIARVAEGPTAGESKSQPLCGRAVELARLHQGFKQAYDGERQFIFVTGEPGIGKTALVDAFLLDIAQQFPLRVCVGQCIESYREQEAFYPVLEAFGRLLQDQAGAEFSELLARHAPTWLTQFPFALTSVTRDLLQSEILGANRDRMLREICQALEVVTTKTPLILVLEDLHWSDHSTLDFIAALARRREPARLLLIATYRPVEVILSRHPLRQLKSELCLHNYAREVPLELLAKAAVSDYLATRFSSSIADQLCADVHQKTDGNPLFIVALMDHLVSQKMIVETEGEWKLECTPEELGAIVPDSLIEIIQTQIDQLDPEDQELVTAASVVGRVFSAAVLAGALNRDRAIVEEHCDSLAGSRLLLRRAGLLDLPDRQVSGLFQFTHALYRDALYNQSSPIARLNLHRRLGESIERTWQGQESEVAAELTHHFEQSRDYERVTRYLRLQAENDEHRYAYRDAITILESALQFAVKLPSSLHNSRVMEITNQLARVYDKMGEKGRAAELYQSVADRAAASNQVIVAAENLLCLSRELSFTDTARALDVAEQAFEMGAKEAGTGFCLSAEAWTSFLQVAWNGWDRDLAIALQDKLDQLRDAGESDLFSQQAFGLAVVQMFTGDHEGALQTTSQSLPLLTRNGDALGHFTVNWMQCWALLKLGRLGECLHRLREAITLPQRNMNAFDTAMGQMFLAELHCEAFDPAGARLLCEQALPIIRSSQSKFAMQRGLITSAIAYLGCGDSSVAGAYLAEMCEMYHASNIGLSWYWKMPLHCALSEHWLSLGDTVASRAEVERLRAVNTDINLSWRARAMEMDARLALAECDTRRAESEITEALKTIEGRNIPLVAWRVHETAAAVFRQNANSTLMKHHLDTRNEILFNLAKSLSENEPLRGSLLHAIER